MARKPRIHIENAVYHVMLRGNNKQQIFFSEADYCRLGLILQQAAIQFNFRIHAFCFMTNHVHLALQISETPLSKIMQSVAFRYAIWINEKYNRVGHLFQGRYRAILVDHEEYLLTLVRYIHLNPVKAQIVNKCDEYYWSSHGTYIGIDHLPWVTVNCVLGMLSEDPKLALEGYHQLLNSNDTARDDFFLNYPVSATILGDSEFESQISEIKNQLNKVTHNLLTPYDVILWFCEKYKLSESILYTQFRNSQITAVRAEIAGLCVQLTVCSVKEIARLLRRSSSYICHLINNLSPEQQEKIEKFKEQIIKQKIEKSGKHP